MKIGIFGGTFNPVHFGHLRAAEEIAQSLDKLIFVPTNQTSGKNDPDISQSSSNRLEMLRIAIKDNKKFEVSDIEIKRGGISYSYDTILSFKELYADDDLYFIVGTDAFLNIKKWKNGENIFDLVNFIIINRMHSGFSSREINKFIDCLPDKPVRKLIIDRKNRKIAISGESSVYLREITRLDISSTTIRENFKKQFSNHYLLPKEVIDYIINVEMYA